MFSVKFYFGYNVNKSVVMEADICTVEHDSGNQMSDLESCKYFACFWCCALKFLSRFWLVEA